MVERDDWNKHWYRYAAAATENPAQRMRHALVTKLLLRGMTGPAPRILDVGSGQGDFLWKLHRAVPHASLIGVELSTTGVEIARKKVPSATFIVANLFQPPVDLQKYQGWATDAACVEVLEHVDDPAAFLLAVRPYLADEGRLIVTVPGGPMSAFDRHIGHRRHFTRDSIGRLLQETGFAVERVYLSGFPFFNVYRGVVIARGERLAVDVDAGHRGFSGRLAAAMMAAFRALFRFNLMDSPLGWQVIAVARKAGSEPVS